jgi:ankyrin repeat protein
LHHPISRLATLLASILLTTSVLADDSTPLQQAAYRGDATEVKRLLAAGASVATANAYGVTPMQLAAETGNTAILQLLLAAGADVESPNSEGQTALMSVARTGNIEAARLLIKRRANVNASEKFGGQTALMWAAARQHPDMVDLLAAKGADVNARAIVRSFDRHITVEGRYKNTHKGGLTALLYAVRENCKPCVEVLIKHRANILLPDPDGVAPLQLAMMNSNWEIAQRLITAGADVNQWDIYGQSPLHVAIENAYSGAGSTNLGSDRTPNSIDCKAIVKQLVERGANPNQQMFFRAPRERGQVSTGARGTTPFHRAAASGDADLVKYLLAHGAEINLHEANGQTASMLALSTRRGEDAAIAVLRVLHDAGADVQGVARIMYIRQDHGGTALHFATRRGLKNAMAELVAYGADVNMKDVDGLTALDYAMSRGWIPFLTVRPAPRMDLVKALRDLGATVELSKLPDWPNEFAPIGPPRQHESEIWPL